MLKHTAVVVAVLLLSTSGLAQAQKPSATAAASQPLAAQLDALLAPQFKPGDPGATVIVVKDGKTVLRKAYGMADVAAKVPLTPATTLRLGSITKQFTAVAILMLADEGRLALNDPITRFFPDFPMQGKVITVEHLLTHTSGIVSYTGKPGFGATMTRDFSVAEMIDGFKNDPLEFEPGTRFHYNNSGYFLLGAIIEKVSGQPYARFLERRIFAPLGMNDTAYEGFERSRAPRAVGHTATDKGFAHSEPLSMSQPYAAGALVSTVDDLATWDAAIQAGQLLTPASWKRAFTSYRMAPDRTANYGYGWHIGKLQGVPMIEHGGGINGFSTHALRIPDRKVYVAVLTNSDSGPANPGLVARKAAGIAIGKPYREFKEVALDGAALDAVTGTYEVEKGVQRVFRRGGDGLVMQRSGRPPVALKAASNDTFFVPGGLDWFEFQRDAAGKVTALTLHQDGNALVHQRIGDAPAGRKAVKIASAAFDTRVGRYELRPGFVMELSREGDRYFAQATGQPKLEIFPMSETVFFSNEVDAEISFEPAAGQDLVLKQGGRSIPARKL